MELSVQQLKKLITSNATTPPSNRQLGGRSVQIHLTIQRSK